MIAGTRLGHYVISGPIGSGGMGEVYEAVDERLDRNVAIKVLPSDVRDDPERLQRFLREAKILAGLTHPYICTLHDVGVSGETHYLVMERLEGESLAQILARERLAPRRALEIGMQLCEALHEAHRNAVVHRDVKPENVVLTRSGAKLLDFGLAHPIELRAGTDPDQTTRIQELTRQGVLVGTLRYMSPEQLHGRPADARSDIFALGHLLYRMLSGRHAFEGSSDAAIIAAILEQDAAEIPESISVHPLLARAIRRCLEKDPENRWQSARDLYLELKSIASTDGASQPVASSPPRSKRSLVWMLAPVILLLGIVLWRSMQSTPAPSLRAHLSISTPNALDTPTPLISPDGSMLAIRANFGDGRQLWLRRLDGTDLRAVPRSMGASNHFWSPDSRRIGFFADGELRIADIDGGPTTTLCEIFGPFPTGSWGSDGTILFSITEAGEQEGLYRIPASGGEPSTVPLRTAEARSLLAVSPSFLPDGRHFVVSVELENESGVHEVGMALASLDANDVRMLNHDVISIARYSTTGHLLYVIDQTLFARPFDLDRLEFAGDPVPVAERVSMHGPLGDYRFSLSDNGVLVYETVGELRELEWRDRSGRSLGSIGAPGYYSSMALSPDDRQLAVVRREPLSTNGDIWIVDLERNVDRRITSDPGDAFHVLWSADGQGIVFANAVAAPPFLHQMDLGDQEAQVLLPSNGNLQLPQSLRSDGSELIFVDRDPKSGLDLWMLPMAAGAAPEPYLRTQADEFGASLSPDDAWIAYISNESGQSEVYVMSYEEKQNTQRISTEGGRTVRWKGDGTELYYLGLDNVIYSVVLEVVAGRATPRSPVPLFTLPRNTIDGNPFDVSRDGQRFVVGRPVVENDEGTHVVLNWAARLEGSR